MKIYLPHVSMKFSRILIVGTMFIIALALSPLADVAFVSAKEQETKGTTNELENKCLQERNNSGLLTKNLSRARRLVISLQYRKCLNRASLLSSQPSIAVLSPNGGGYWYMRKTAVIEWKTTSIPQGNIMTIRLRAVESGIEYPFLETNNDGYEKIAVPSSIPVGMYRLEVKTSVNGQSYMDSSDAYFKIVDATPAAISEQVKCVFVGAMTEQSCHTAVSSDSSLAFGCSGVGTCVTDVKGSKGTSLIWKSSCGGYAYTMLDGNNEYANFSCQDASQPSVSVISPNGGGTWSMGEQKRIELRVSGAPAGSYLQVSLTDGPTPIDIKAYADPSGNISFNYTLPTSGCHTDYCYDLKIGSYKISAVLYDKAPCNMRYPCTQEKFLTSDSSDASFTVMSSLYRPFLR